MFIHPASQSKRHSRHEMGEALENNHKRLVVFGKESTPDHVVLRAIVAPHPPDP